MERRRPERTNVWALVLSLGLHALLLAWAVLWPGEPPLREGRSQAIELEIITTEVLPPPLPPREEERPQAPAEPLRPSKKRARAEAAAPVELFVPPSAQGGAEAGPAKQAAAGPALDAPRSLSLQPSLGVVLPELGTGERELSKGRTVVNGPGEEPDAVAVREYTQDSIKRRLDEELAHGAAAARARSGLMDPYFTRLGSKLNEGINKAQVQLRDRTAGELLREEVFGTWQGIASRYGKDGNPLGSAEEERRVTDTALGRQVSENRVPFSDMEGQREMGKAMQQFGAMEAFIASAQRARLRTVIELRQDASGALAEAVFLERSGDEKFDEFALHQARKVVREKGEVEEGEPPFKEGWRSVWAFTWEPPKVKAKLLRVLRGQPAQPLLLPRQ